MAVASMEEVSVVPKPRKEDAVKRLSYCLLCLVLCLAALAVSPRTAAADCQEGCCEQAQRDVEGYCSYSYVESFQCIEGYGGSCCAVWYRCAPPWA
jgi:hypothetical protein